jgi:L-lactate dehydrogenase (cytochrome)
MVSSNASLSPTAIMQASDQTQPLFFQLYKHRDDDVAEKRVREIETLGYKAIFLTVDAIVAGNRESDIRSPWVLDEQENGSIYYQESIGTKTIEDVNILGTAGALVAHDDRDMTWEKVRFYHLEITKKKNIKGNNQSLLDHTMVTEDHQASDCHQRFEHLYLLNLELR